MPLDPVIAALYKKAGLQKPITDPVKRREQAEQLDAAAYAEYGTPGPTVRTTEVTVPVAGYPDVRLRLHFPDSDGPHPAYLVFFGGAFRQGGIDYASNVGAYSARTVDADVVTVAVDYALAPEHKWPAAVEQGYAALEWLVEHGAEHGIDPSRIAIGGQSSGGNIAACVCLVNRDRANHPLRLQLLEVPSLDLTRGSIDVRPARELHIPVFLMKRGLVGVVKDYFDDYRRQGFEPYASPLRAPSVAGLHPHRRVRRAARRRREVRGEAAGGGRGGQRGALPRALARGRRLHQGPPRRAALGAGCHRDPADPARLITTAPTTKGTTTMSQPTSPPPVTVAPGIPADAPGPKQGRWFLPTFVLAWFGVNLALGTIGGASIPKALAFLDDGAKDTNLAIIAGVGGIVVMIITPLFGRLSDRTRSAFGMRRPWMLGGVIVGVLGVAGLAFSPSLPVMVLSWAVVQIGFGATNMAQHALLADQVPTRIRARVAAATGVSGGIATILGAAIVASLPNDERATWFLVPGLVGALFAVVLVLGLRDRVRTEPAEPLSLRAILSTYWLSPARYRDFAWAWACRLLVTMSIVSVSLYLLFFIIDRLGIPKEQASGVQAQALLFFFVGNVVMTLLFGWISDRTGKRKIIVFASCLVTCAGLLLAILAPDTLTFMLAIAIVGAGQGAYISVDVALMTEVLPDFENAGKDLGIVALAYQLPQLLVPIIAVPVLAIGGGGNYTALYLVAIGLSLLGGLAVLPIRKVN